MKFKRLTAFALSLVLTVSVSAPALAEEAAAEAPVLTREEFALAAASAAAQYGGATAVQYAVWENGKLTITGSTGTYSKTENRALTDDDLYGIGSVSKIYTTAAVMKLVEARKINLDAPVTQYLPTFKMADERYKLITVRMLLNHSSGLMGSSFNDAMLFGDDDQVATKDLLNRLSTQRLKADPGEIAVYCNDGFTLAELVVEAVSGQDFGAYIHGNLLKTAGLDDTFAPQDEFDTSRLVKTYLNATDTRALAQDALGVVGCGGLYATASDLASFGGALTGTGLLSAKSTAAMANAEYKNGIWPADDADMVAYGLGWDSMKVYPFAANNIQALAKGGDTQFYHAALVVIPKYNMAAAVLSSGGISTYNEMAANQMLVDALKAKGVAVDQTPLTLPQAAPAAMPAALTDLSGYYGNSTQTLKVTVTADGKLTFHALGAPAETDLICTYYSDGSFRDATNQLLLKLVTEKNGVTYFYQKTCGAIPGLGYMPTSQYAAQKLPANEVSAEVQAAWDRFNTMPMFPVNMKYTSQMYPVLFAATAAAAAMADAGGTVESIPGYLGSIPIVDATTAQSVVQVPQAGGRDCQDLTVYEEDGVTYFSNTQGILYRDGSDVAALYTGATAYTTIGDNGYARWYTLNEKADGKTMTVTVPEAGGFYVYGADGSVVASSVAFGDTTAVLPAGGMVVFAGAPGTRFNLSFTK